MTLSAAFAELYIIIINTHASYIVILFGVCFYKAYYFGSGAIFYRTAIYNQYIHTCLHKIFCLFVHHNTIPSVDKVTLYVSKKNRLDCAPPYENVILEQKMKGRSMAGNILLCYNHLENQQSEDKNMQSQALPQAQGPERPIGISSFTLKALALFLMTLDHIHYYLGGNILPVPALFTMLGRISAPLFLFTMTQGFVHTHDRKLYLKRLYIASVLMAAGNMLMNRFFPHPEGAVIINGMFSTLFLIGLYLQAAELMHAGIKERRAGKALTALFMFAVPFLSGVILLAAIILPPSPAVRVLCGILTIFVPSPIFAEGSFMWVILGMCFYFLRGRRLLLSAAYVAVSCFFFVIAAGEGITYENLFHANNQWLMIFALVLILLYNGTRGKKMKYFFYLYYPLHVYALVIAARVLAGG